MIFCNNYHNFAIKSWTKIYFGFYQSEKRLLDDEWNGIGRGSVNVGIG